LVFLPAFAFYGKMKAPALHFSFNRSPRSGLEPEGLKAGKRKKEKIHHFSRFSS
jgi:hypothetical protein